MQTSLKATVSFPGIGLHSGRPVRMVVHPATAGQGILFRRTDVQGDAALVPVRWQGLQDTPLCTRMTNDAGVSVSTIEHVMAAFSGCGIHNALVEIDGPEVPILDGSAAPFVAKFLRVGVRRLDAPLKVLRIRAPVEVRDSRDPDAWARLDPAAQFEMDFTIDFPDRAIGRQHKRLVLSNGTFLRELANSRTFARRDDIETMRAAGLALGGTLENAVVFDGDGVLNPEGLRHPDEAVRHKMLDAIGDLYASGMPILGRFSGYRSGHSLTAKLLRAVFAETGNYIISDCLAEEAGKLPGTRLQPADLALSA